MQIKNLNNSAFTLLEVLLASLIFVISVIGIFATLNAVRLPVSNKENALAAAVLGKQALEALRSQVNAAVNATTGVGTFYGSCGTINADNSCGDFSLFLGQHEVSTATLATYGLNNFPSGFAALNPNGLIYTVSCGDGTASSGTPPACSSDNIARRVDLSINW